MTNTSFGKRIMMLEEMGFDTSKYHLEVKGNQIEITGVAKEIVENKHVKNYKIDRKWVMAQTFRMLYEPTYNHKTRQKEIGWDNYLRNKKDYMYQFHVMSDELKNLSKLERKDREKFLERSNFFTKEVVVATCMHYLEQFDNYVKENWDSKSNKVKLSKKYGWTDASEYANIVKSLLDAIEDIKCAKNYNEMYVYLNKFVDRMNVVPFDTPKCPEWKVAFRGNGAYYSLENMIRHHKCLLRGCFDENESISKLKECLETYRGEYWRFHSMLKDTIECNNFDLRESIRRNK